MYGGKLLKYQLPLPATNCSINKYFNAQYYTLTFAPHPGDKLSDISLVNFIKHASACVEEKCSGVIK